MVYFIIALIGLSGSACILSGTYIVWFGLNGFFDMALLTTASLLISALAFSFSCYALQTVTQIKEG